jgi:hypothetical protein
MIRELFSLFPSDISTPLKNGKKENLFLPVKRDSGIKSSPLQKKD